MRFRELRIRSTPPNVGISGEILDDRRYVMLTKGFTREELDEQSAVELPDRTEMSLVNANVAAPINAALALNVLSDNSTATAIAMQTNYIPQSI